MNKTDIEWCDYTWNPVTGCKRGCEYCYARRIHERFYNNPFSDIIYHAERILDPLKKKASAVIFVGSMSDIEYWEKWQVQAILDIVKLCKQHTFMFLSKNPDSYLNISWPSNTMQGLTITKNNSFEDPIKIVSMTDYPRPYLSIEPLQGVVGYTHAFEDMEKIIVGAMTGRGAIIPNPEWVQSVKDSLPKHNLFYKSNIKQYL